MSFWARIKKIALVVGLLAGVVAILGTIVGIVVNWKTITGPSPPLEANGESIYAPSNPVLVSLVEGLRERSLTNVFKATLDKYKGTKIDGASADVIAKGLSETVASKIPSYMVYLYFPFRITHLDIKARAACHNVKVSVSRGADFSVSRNNQQPVITQDDQEVMIGNLQAGDDVDMFAWVVSTPHTPSEILVTSDEGAATVKILGAPVHATLWDTLFWYIWGVCLPVIGVIAIIWCFLPKNIRQRLHKPADNLDRTSK